MSCNNKRSKGHTSNKKRLKKTQQKYTEPGSCYPTILPTKVGHNGYIDLKTKAHTDETQGLKQEHDCNTMDRPSKQLKYVESYESGTISDPIIIVSNVNESNGSITNCSDTAGEGCSSDAPLVNAPLVNAPLVNGGLQNGSTDSGQTKQPKEQDASQSASYTFRKRVAVSTDSPAPCSKKQSVYKMISCIQEGHKQVVYCVAFRKDCDLDCTTFCVAGCMGLSVYNIQDDDTVELLQAYKNEGEIFYTCTWSRKLDGAPLLVAAGHSGLIYVINCVTVSIEHVLRGHGDEVFDLSVMPGRPDVLASCSADRSIRVSNIKTGKTIAVLSGDYSHGEGVVTCQWHRNRNYILVSAGLDRCICIWDLKPYEKHFRIAAQFDVQSKASIPKAVLVQKPIFSSLNIHSKFVDCIRWAGDYLISKSTNNEALIWRPTPCLVTLLETHQCKPCQSHVVVYSIPLPGTGMVWWIRFDLDLSQRYMVCGNTYGAVKVIDLHQPASPQVVISRQLRLVKYDSEGNVCTDTNEKSKIFIDAVRQADVSCYSNYVVAGTDSGQVIVQRRIVKLQGDTEQEH